MVELEPVEGWEYLMRDFAGNLVLENEDKSSENVTFTESADIIFTDFYERDKDVDEIADETSLTTGQVEELIDYTEAGSENLHELARKAYEKRKFVQEASEESVEDIMNRALENDGEIEHVEYGGPMGALQDLVEEAVDQRGFKMRYNPSEDQSHRSGLEVHVLPEKEADEEFYFGMDESGLYFGSTFSEADLMVNDVEGAESYIRTELDALEHVEKE